MKKATLCLAGLFVFILAESVCANTCWECERTFWPKEGANGRYCWRCVSLKRIKANPQSLEAAWVKYVYGGEDNYRKLMDLCDSINSRGDKDTVSQAMPKVVKVEFGKWDTLKKGEQPLWDDYITAFYDGMKKEDAKALAEKVNQARATLNAEELARTAVILSDYKAKKDIPVYFKPDTLFTEAIHLTVLCGKIGNAPALMKLKAMYEKAPFKNSNTLEELNEEIDALTKKPAKK